MTLTGTMWRAKVSPGYGPSPQFMMGAYPVTARPIPSGLLLSSETPMRWVVVDEIVLIGSEPVPRDEIKFSYERHQTFVRILMPVSGYMNSTYFVNNGMWFNRIA